ncbi:TetR/AcrR family transcriptional regulator [Weissella paramesenteroides]|uniref:TetR/AcrR family transcriptional regulator n=1 Tax=Weissella paramesenteroides TaxID=1249 RepID=UPI001239EAC0|nr:TetR/AcrR family transcriptional regulator [Weissella paramesenteroides]KAA8438738.1 TetR/AcrR family transcriptional regulator [Weissella paramesenteroides]KAA8440790.1 TetR/AcrR family transcriptional regulator [Weissella paramesenteroides]KAA8443221.1 TetR/AcrR family transcriptional regulator [Weissella paramesenteroides]KAA8445407.1 TetR/AcrR family transcriptional regulator [Weissella paramesenteroides]KAA8448802.1 TetR/AcrR family transcriptional regulator [Weissella paramesenteroide
MYEGNNPTALQSKQMIINAMFELLKEESYQNISIKKLADRAKLSRQTFYANFANREEVIRSELDRIFIEYKQAIDKSDNSSNQLIRLFFKFYKSHEQMIDVLLANHLEPLLTEVSRECMDSLQISNEANNQYVYGFVAGGLTQILSDWNRRNKDLPIEALASLTEGLLNPQSFNTTTQEEK